MLISLYKSQMIMRNSYTDIVLIFFLLFYFGHGDNTPDCKSMERTASYLDVAVDMIGKAKAHYPNCPKVAQNASKPVDCEELLRMGSKVNGVYTIWPRSRIFDDKSLDVYCDMQTDDGGWTVLQRRGNFSRPKDFFFKDWKSYKSGFGGIEKDFWLGNDNIFGLTNQRSYSIRFDLKDVEGNTAYALYDTFWIDDEDHKYTVHIKDYSGSAGDSMISHHDNHKFSTKDQDNDANAEQNCAEIFKGGWWYNACHQSNLNGLYLYGKHDSFADGIDCLSWKGYKESMAATEMKIRPKNFRKQIVRTKNTKKEIENVETPK